MTFLSTLLAADPGVNINDERYWTNFSGQATASGITINPETALKVSTAWACVGLLADCVAMLPAIVYENLGEGDKQRATSHPLYDVLHDQPNTQQTAFEFKNMMQGHLELRGNAYAKIIPGPRGFADQLVPVHPDRVTPEVLSDGALRYKITDLDNVRRVYNDDDILHIRGFSTDGRIGLPTVSYARESLGLALAAEESGARTLRNGSRPSGVLKMPGKLTPQGAVRMKDSWQAANAGVGNTGKVAVLEEGLEWQAIGFNNKDTQWMESREFQAEDICRWFRVPPHMVGLTSKATSWGTGLEQMSVGFVTYTLMPRLVRWQQAIARDLIIATRKYFVEFVVDALLRSDLPSRYNAYAIARNWGWLSVNDIRRKENENPIEGGDIYLTPMNMTDASQPPAAADDMPTDDMPMDTPDRMPMNDQSAHYRELLYESAARVVRKEIAFLTKLSGRFAEQSTEWLKEMMEFYEKHAALVSSTLRIDRALADAYTQSRVKELMEIGTGEMGTWEQFGVGQLVEMVLS